MHSLLSHPFPLSRAGMVRVNLDVDSPRGGAGAGSLPGTSPSNAGSWRWRDVQLRRVLAQQDWGGLLTAAFICVGLLIAQVRCS